MIEVCKARPHDIRVSTYASFGRVMLIGRVWIGGVGQVFLDSVDLFVLVRGGG